MLLFVLLFVIVMLPLLLMLIMQLLIMCFIFLGMFSTLIMPPEVYLELTSMFSMPIPIPKPQDVHGSDLHYMSFEEAVAHPFSKEH